MNDIEFNQMENKLISKEQIETLDRLFLDTVLDTEIKSDEDLIALSRHL